jgi:L-iditol 2-dehydrogenase
MQACVLHGVGDLRYEEVPTPKIKKNQVLVKVRAAGVCGSDIPRIFVNGTYHFPTIPGHEFAGEVVEVGEDVKDVTIGTRAAIFPLIPCYKCPSCEIGEYAQCDDYDYLGSRCDGGFAEYVAVPAANIVPLPNGVSFEEAAMTEPAAVAIHALRRAGIDVGDAVAIFGVGPIGLMLGQWASIWGAGKVLLIDIDDAKLAVAKKMGFENVFNSRCEDPVKWIRDMTSDLGADLVLEGAGASQTFNQAILAVRKAGAVVIMGNPAGDVVLPQNTVSQLLRKQAVIYGTWNSSFTTIPKNEWKLTLEMVSRKRLDLKSIITHRVTFDKANAALLMMRDKTEFCNKVMFVNK